MKQTSTDLPGVLLLEPRVFGDDRGYFFESFNRNVFADAGLTVEFVQDNISKSVGGVIRGLHLQNPNSQGKLITVLDGSVVDVAVDVRVGSPTFGRWVSFELSSANKRHVYIPPGMAHGFAVTSDSAIFSYKCTTYYAPEHELTIRWDDPDLAITWPVSSPVLSAKDRAGALLADCPPDRLPQYVG
ncbi:MAG TPA: dTDP-4-dehydrorhamnose 3,5-epimerase [Gemmatimonadaceae bacterium]